MEKSDQKVGKVFLIFTGICIIVLPFIIMLAFSSEPEKMETENVLEIEDTVFDQNGAAVFLSHDSLSKEYLEGISTGRTLEEYYSRRQYIGSPPFIPHKIEATEEASPGCLTCHARGGWTEELKRNTPITPHPENIACLQCHVEVKTDTLFVTNDWKSSPPPRLGRSYLPGSPSPIPHDLQMRGDCIACHVGPGAVDAIRVEHPSRGNCRQCHVPDSFAGLFQR